MPEKLIDEKIDEKIDVKIEAAKLTVANIAADAPIASEAPITPVQEAHPESEPFGVTTQTTTKRPLRESNPLNTSENRAATTTAEEDKRSLGQRDINILWETTQQKVALFVVAVTMTVSSLIILHAVFFAVSESELALAIAAFTFISSTTSLVVGFYFSRTNHARIGDDRKTTIGGLDDR